ncbi:DUF6214 family protein [Streptomyces sp. B93]|uniref:DUF6214 family protein n=1 Tax=Streptomyces sp. B93 TaxID=2824875 RepID=UPI001B37F73D|nr:DUF6214 family protein [Streptomyces sp. B93]MBQ1092564.1 hypothetical protein [Streptomyces sp. B93]
MSVRPAWEVQEGARATRWFQVRLAFGDGAEVTALALVSDGCLSIEDVRAQPALSLEDLTVLADWLEEPLSEACGAARQPSGERYDAQGPGGSRHARPAWPLGVEGRRLIAEEYRAAQEEGLDPVLAVMCATGHSRRRALRLIAQARDAGFLTARHARR